MYVILDRFDLSEALRGGLRKEALDILGFWSAQERSTRYLGILGGAGGE